MHLRPIAGAVGQTAAMTVRLELPFTITTWDVVPDAAPTDEGAPDTGRVVLAKTYAGDDLNGTATGHALMTRGDNGASYVAQERIVGTPARALGELRAGARRVDGGGPGDRDARRRSSPGRAPVHWPGSAGTGMVEHELLTLEVDLPDW